MQCFQTALRVGYIGLGETGHTFTRTWGHHLLLVAVKSSLLHPHAVCTDAREILDAGPVSFVSDSFSFPLYDSAAPPVSQRKVPVSILNDPFPGPGTSLPEIIFGSKTGFLLTHCYNHYTGYAEMGHNGGDCQLHKKILSLFGVHRLHFPASFANRCGHMTKFSPVECEWAEALRAKFQAWSIKNLPHSSSFLCPPSD